MEDGQPGQVGLNATKHVVQGCHFEIVIVQVLSLGMMDILVMARKRNLESVQKIKTSQNVGKLVF